jgi:hypothetical protein
MPEKLRLSRRVLDPADADRLVAWTAFQRYLNWSPVLRVMLAWHLAQLVARRVTELHDCVEPEVCFP